MTALKYEETETEIMEPRDMRLCIEPKLENGPGDAEEPRDPHLNAARERSRVRSLRVAFTELQQALPCVPPDTKLSKLDVLVLGEYCFFVRECVLTTAAGDNKSVGHH